MKVELPTGETGFGRATILAKEGNKLLIQLRTSKESHEVMPRGSKLYLVTDSASNPFNGLWSTSVVGARIHGGKTVMECSSPKFQPLDQRRHTQRFSLSCPVTVSSEKKGIFPYEIRARDISRAGLGLETEKQDIPEFEFGQMVRVIIHTGTSDIEVECRVVRSQYNWLQNRHSIGLEFVTMTAQESLALRNLFDNLEKGVPVSSGESSQWGDSGSLSKWMKGSKDSMRLVKPLPSDGDSDLPLNQIERQEDS